MPINQLHSRKPENDKLRHIQIKISLYVSTSATLHNTATEDLFIIRNLIYDPRTVFYGR